MYGYRRVHGDQSELGETCGKNRVGRIMQLNRTKAVAAIKPDAVYPADLQSWLLIVYSDSLLSCGLIRSG